MELAPKSPLNLLLTNSVYEQCMQFALHNRASERLVEKGIHQITENTCRYL